jgi:hypothetical protein
MNINIYISKILPYVYKRQEYLAKEGKHMLFQEDNDGAHGNSSFENDARMNKDEHDLDYIHDWPAKSPDLSPIENVWRILKGRVKLHAAQTVEELKKAILYEWRKITLEEINRLILGAEKGKYADWHWRDRLQSVLDRNGYSTKY